MTAVFTPEQAGAYLGVSDSTVRREIAAGRIPALRVGRQLRIPVESLRRLVAMDGWQPATATRPASPIPQLAYTGECQKLADELKAKKRRVERES